MDADGSTGGLNASGGTPPTTPERPMPTRQAADTPERPRACCAASRPTDSEPHVATPEGEIPAATLAPGWSVLTRGAGVQPVRAVALDRLAAAQTARTGAVRIRRGALGHGLPERDQVVPPDRRVLAPAGPGAAGRPRLTAAEALVGRPGIDRAGPCAATVVHLTLDRDQIVLIDGVWTECARPAPGAPCGRPDATAAPAPEPEAAPRPRSDRSRPRPPGRRGAVLLR